MQYNKIGHPFSENLSAGGFVSHDFLKIAPADLPGCL